MIVLIGTTKQYQVETIFNKLKLSNIETVLIDFLKARTICVSNERNEIEIKYDGISLNNSKVVYHDPKYLVPQFGCDEEWAQKYTEQYGWRHANYSVFELLKGTKLNPLSSIFPFFEKLKQLEIAVSCGFSIPPFCLTNGREEIQQFHKSFDSIITKDIGAGHIPKFNEDGVYQHALMTAPISDNLVDEIDEFQPFPILLQKNIKKQFEYRVVVAGNGIQVFKIDPKQHPLMAQDYRRGGYMVEYLPSQLNDQLEKKIFALHKKLGLFSGSYDFIEDLNGEFFFLEVNPAGVWGYIDKMAGGRVSDMFVKEIINVYNLNNAS